MRTATETSSDSAFPTGPDGGRVLVADDAPANVALLRRLLARDRHTVLTAADGVAALDLVRRERPDLIVLDVMMPGLNGVDVCRAIKGQPETRLTPVVLVTALEGREDRLRGIEAGADDFVTKPFDPVELGARIRSLLRLKRYTDELDSAEAVILSLALTVEARDPDTEGHCQRLARHAAALGRRLGLAGDDIGALERGGILHDIGKVGVPDAVLLKPGPLNDTELAQMRLHTVIGDRLCSQLRLLERVRPIVRSHHERLDGSGYPDGLRGNAVPLVAQIIGIIDVYDALTTSRPYKKAFDRARAIEELRAEARRGWRDGALVAEFITLLEDDPEAGTPA